MTRTSGKIAVSLPKDQIEAARQAVANGQAPSVSAYVSDALARVKRDASLAGLVAQLIAEDGTPTAADYAWADDVLARST